MIRVNLAKKKKAGFLAGEGKGGFLGNLKVDPSDLKDLPFLKLGLMIAAIMVGRYVVSDLKNQKITEVDERIKKLTTEQTQLNAEISKMKSVEPIKVQLEKDEVTIRAKIEAIEKLVSNRNETTTRLTTLSGLIPEQVWLDSLKINDEQVSMTGKAVGISTVSEFLRSLKENVLFSNLILNDTQQADDLGLEIAKFSFSTEKMNEGGAFTAPRPRGR